MEIKEAGLNDVEIITFIIKNANREISIKLQLSSESAPGHPSNCKKEWIEENMSRSEIYFISYQNEKPVGTIAYKIKSGCLTIKHLAVLPEQQYKGIGKLLIEHAIIYGRDRGLTAINLGMVADNKPLKEWYGRLGFVIKKTKTFKNLPIKIAFMKRFYKFFIYMVSLF